MGFSEFRDLLHLPPRYLIVAFFIAVLRASSSALAAEPGEVVIGPISYVQDVNGVPVTIIATTYVKVITEDNQILVKARVVGNLSDLQQKIGTIVDTFDLPRDNCKSYSPKNPVVSIPRKELFFRDGAAVFSLGANVTVWACVENPVPNSKLETGWCKVGPIKTKCPKVVTWPGSPIKTHAGAQNLDADIPVFLVRNNDHAVGIQFSKPDINLGDCSWFACVAKGIVNLGGIDVNQKAYDALQKAIDPEKLRLAIPEELSSFNPVVEAARFVSDTGNLAAEISVSAMVPAASMTELIKQLLEKGAKN